MVNSKALHSPLWSFWLRFDHEVFFRRLRLIRFFKCIIKRVVVITSTIDSPTELRRTDHLITISIARFEPKLWLPNQALIAAHRHDILVR